MNALDLIFLGIMGVNLLYSTWKGFIRDVFSLAGLVGGFIIACRYYSVAADWVSSWVPYPEIASILGWILIFLIVYIAVGILGRMVRGSFQILRMGWVDSVAGFFFGFIKGVLFCAGLLVVLVALLPPEASLLKKSRLAPHVMGLTYELGRLAPGHIGERFRKSPDPSSISQRTRRAETRERGGKNLPCAPG